MDMGSNEYPNSLDDEVFFGPVTQRELIITWRKRRQERLKREQAETLKKLEDGTQPNGVDSGEPTLKKPYVQTEEHELSATISGDSSKNTTDANGTANIGSDDQLQDKICRPVGKKEEDESEVLRTNKLRFANEHKEAPIVGGVSVDGNASESQDESLSPSMLSSDLKTGESLCLIQKAEDVTSNKNVLDEVGESNTSASNTWCMVAPSVEEAPIVDKSWGNQESDMNVSPQEDNHEVPMTVKESNLNQPIAEPVETPSKETSFCSADQSINEMSSEINESVREPIAEQQLSLEPKHTSQGTFRLLLMKMMVLTKQETAKIPWMVISSLIVHRKPTKFSLILNRRKIKRTGRWIRTPSWPKIA
uniref:Uncharacterized protein n=1 Tax=Lygus hesperus TaxID=30085 RepID=A0A0A9WVY8_LYGHE